MLWCSFSADEPFTAFNHASAGTISPAVTPASAHVAHGLLLTPAVTPAGSVSHSSHHDYKPVVSSVSPPETKCVEHLEEKCNTIYEEVCVEPPPLPCIPITEQECNDVDVEICVNVKETECTTNNKEVCINKPKRPSRCDSIG